MTSNFYQYILKKHQHVNSVPCNQEITDWAVQIIRLLFPEQFKKTFADIKAIESEFFRLKQELCRILNATNTDPSYDSKVQSSKFFEHIPEMYNLLKTDLQAICNGDPAAKSEFEVIRTYPGFLAISFYRLAHLLHLDNIPLLPRILTEYAHSKTGIDIHPAAKIGAYFHIDHGTGVVIGESCEIGQNVKLYQGVTLGALSVDKNMANTKRHPTLEDNVIIYAGATILGGKTTVGHNSVIGGNIWLTSSIPPYSILYHTPHYKMANREAV
jgi:serine O-acetyltransferase